MKRMCNKNIKHCVYLDSRKFRGRLKACPDCRWVFYDHSRNGSKRWCGMYAGEEGGRACGTIAKVKNYRAKRKGRTGYNV